MAAPRPLQRTQHRVARRRLRSHTEERNAVERTTRHSAAIWQRRRLYPWRAKVPASHFSIQIHRLAGTLALHFFDAARLPEMCAQFRRTRPTPFLVQLQTRLVSELLWDRTENARLRRRTNGR